MPTYEYACRDCGEHLEAVQSFGDDPLTECPACGGELRKVFSAVGVVFKGSGFYKTDSRPAKKSSSSSDGASRESGSGSSDGASRDGGSKSSGDGVKKSGDQSPSSPPASTSPGSKEPKTTSGATAATA